MRRVVASVEAPDYDTQRLRARLPWLTLAVCVAAAGGLAIAWVIWRQAMADLWSLYWVALVVCALISFYLVGSVIQRMSKYPFAWETPEALIVRAATVASDERIAPLARIQPASADDAWGAPGIGRVVKLRRPYVTLDRRTLATLAFSLLFLLVFQMMLFVSFANDGGFQIWEALPLIWLAAMIVGAGIFLRWMRRPASVVIGDDGVRWQRGLRRHTLRWGDAQALCVIERRDTMDGRSQRVYWLQAADGALVWTSRWVKWERDSLTNEAIDLTDPSDPAWRFCALASMRTGQPLRDLTATMESLVTVEPGLAAKWRTLAPGFIAPLGSAAHVRILRQRAVALWRLRALTAVLLALSLMLLGAGLGLLVAAPRVYGAQLAQAQRQPPIFADTLTPASAQWTDLTIAGPTFEPIDNAAGMLGDGYGNFALAAPHVRDGVVEVTVHHIVGSEYDWNGIILRGDQTKNRALIFAINSEGMWALDRLKLKPGDSGFGPDDSLIRLGLLTPMLAIHQGDTAVNRLAVIMRGGDYTFFVNGQYVGSYHETQDTGDRVGLAAESDSMLVGFSDFAIYPAPQASPPFPV